MKRQVSNNKPRETIDTKKARNPWKSRIRVASLVFVSLIVRDKGKM